MKPARLPLLLSSGLLVALSAGAQVSPADAVNPLIGTAAEGQTFPAAGVPFAMTQWTPQTRDGETKCIAPYYVADTRLQGFRGSHFLSGSCTQDYGSVTLMPLLSSKVLDPQGRSSRLDHAREKSRAYEYSVDLDTGIHADVTGTERSGVMRFRFPDGAKGGFVAVQENHRLGVGTVRINAAKQEITGENPIFRIYAGSGKPTGNRGYFVVRFSRPFTVGGVWSGDSRKEGAQEQSGTKSAAGAYVSFDLAGSRDVVAQVGTSFTSLEAARRNLDEVPAGGFDAVVANAKAAWESALGQIQVGPTASASDRTIFYTALFHSMLLPRILSDRDGSYPRFAGNGKIEVAKGFTYYDDFSLWDTFRAVHPLLTVLQPKRERDMVQSLLVKGEQGGFLPIYPAWSSYTTEMVGDHADAVIADAYVKGIRNFDVQQAYRLMKKNATQGPETKELYLDGRGRRGLDSYLKYGYIPLEDHISDAFHPDEQVSRTLEYAYDDFLVGRMAQWTGHGAEAKQFFDRGQNFRKVIDPSVGYARGRHADGTWATPFDPNKAATWITEGLPSQYTFFVLQDMPALVDLLGGKPKFTARLDDLFKAGAYNHGNEPSHHLAYLYNFADQPAKTQFQVRQILRTLYQDSPGGLQGNDDAGQMSAWYVFSALGFYPVTPGTPRYELGVPLFDDATVRLPNGHRLHIVATGASKGMFKVRKVTLNGRVLGRTYLLHDELVAGGELRFELEATSNPQQK
ncbi:alpha-1,2-mannosidase, putative [Terriglobus roseus DSM 18391]|uniref:Alpha-1,2-mannosidase, putative n=1 Tax=Terriglobus roseus (strain DSM 18391 / NRRL B-41598 / KBS 63) TaxID=926566 RepID=I3ZK24_TERRK|nr:GH92 family glycosyl hydrolase [Terriglobus roseus]AFL89592.1 alpha-1,2-mannosidase, putative [Terriglobus roseus DSM 18391]